MYLKVFCIKESATEHVFPWGKVNCMETWPCCTIQQSKQTSLQL